MKKSLLIGTFIASIVSLNASVMKFELINLKQGPTYIWDSDLSVKNGKPNFEAIVKKNKLVPLDSSLGFSILDYATIEFECGGKGKEKCSYDLIKNFVNKFNADVKRKKEAKNQRQKAQDIADDIIKNYQKYSD